MWSEKCEENFEEGTQFSTRNFDRDLKLQLFKAQAPKKFKKEGT